MSVFGREQRGLRGGRAWAWVVALLLVAPPAWGRWVGNPLLSVSSEGRYDDDPLARQAGDFMLKLSPEAGYRLTAPETLAEGRYAVDMIYHPAHGSFGLDHRARLLLQDRPGERSALKASAALWRVEDSTSLPRPGIARVLAPVLYLQADGSASYRLSRRDTVELSYRGELAQIYAPGFSLGQAHAPALALRHRLSRLIDGGAKYRLQGFLVKGKSAVGHGAFGTLALRLARHVALSAEGGPIAYLEDGRGSLALHAAAELGYEARGMELGLSAGRDLAGAVGFAASVWSDYLQAGGAYRPIKSLRLFAGGGAFRNGPAPSGPVDATGYQVQAGTELSLTPYFAVEATVSRLGQLDSPTAKVSSFTQHIGLFLVKARIR